jgi:hypothetical protein
MESADLHILPASNRPEFLLSLSGVLEIRGRALLADEDEVVNQVLNWIDVYLDNPAEITTVIIGFEYLNSFSTLILVNILKKLSAVIQHPKKLVIRWFYEEDDDDIIERGQAISTIISCPIEFIQVRNIAIP